MRQGDGTDLLGTSSPRSAGIGVIYVAPDDDRQSVLTGILTQDKLGYKQVIVVLPDQNKSFQRPVDFDGLKNMRRGLKAEIIFIAPSGPGPAEYARQRRFPVYASIEAFAQSMRLESLSTVNARRSSKKGLLGIGGKEEIAGGVAVAALSNHSEQENTISTLPVNDAASSSPNVYPTASDQVVNEANESNGKITNGNGSGCCGRFSSSFNR
jgi:hypothetical protein